MQHTRERKGVSAEHARLMRRATRLALAVALSSYHSYVMAHFPWMKAGGSVLMAFIIGTLISVVASIAPAYWAARKQPVEALSVEE